MKALTTTTGTAPDTLRGGVEEAIANARSKNTRRQYKYAFNSWVLWCNTKGLAALPAEPLSIAMYLTDRATTSSAATLSLDRAAIAAAHKDAGYPDPTNDEGVKRVLKGLKRTAKNGRGQAKPLPIKAVERIMESAAPIDKAICGLLFYAGLRRSEAAALKWDQLQETDEGLRVNLEKSKTNQDGTRKDVRFVKGPAVQAILGLPKKGDRVLGLNGQSIANHLRNAAHKAGVKGITGHSGRVGLATELTVRGATTTETMLAGGWTTERMVVHYAAEANAERGAVSKYL